MMKWSVRLVYILLSIFLIIGQVVFALGSYLNSFDVMLAGRIIFGIGGESLNITQYTMIFKWFHSSELAMPLGIAGSISRFGSVLNDIISPIIVSVCK